MYSIDANDRNIPMLNRYDSGFSVRKRTYRVCKAAKISGQASMNGYDSTHITALEVQTIAVIAPMVLFLTESWLAVSIELKKKTEKVKMRNVNTVMTHGAELKAEAKALYSGAGFTLAYKSRGTLMNAGNQAVTSISTMTANCAA